MPVSGFLQHPRGAGWLAGLYFRKQALVHNFHLIWRATLQCLLLAFHPCINRRCESRREDLQKWDRWPVQPGCNGRQPYGRAKSPDLLALDTESPLSAIGGNEAADGCWPGRRRSTSIHPNHFTLPGAPQAFLASQQKREVLVSSELAPHHGYTCNKEPALRFALRQSSMRQTGSSLEILTMNLRPADSICQEEPSSWQEHIG